MTWKAVCSMWLNENKLQNNVFVTLFLIRVHEHKHTQTYLHEHRKSLAWRIPGTGEVVGCCLWDHTESDMTEEI